MISNFVIASLIVVVVYDLTTLGSSYVAFKGGSARNKKIWFLGVLDSVAFPISIIVLSFLLPTNNLLDILSLLTYAIVSSFVVTIEVPGYLVLTKYDNSMSDSLNEIRDSFFDTKIDFLKNFKKLEEVVKMNQSELKDSKQDHLVDEFIKSCNQSDSFDPNIWDLAVGELNKTIDKYDSQTKHPIPKLIDLLSLAGLSFLIAQILKILGA